jgi:hypothetical protein
LNTREFEFGKHVAVIYVFSLFFQVVVVGVAGGLTSSSASHYYCCCGGVMYGLSVCRGCRRISLYNYVVFGDGFLVHG